MENRSGYDLNFVEEFSDHLICVICQMVFKEPVSLVECGHTFCHCCFDKIIEHAVQRNERVFCPTDRTMIDVNKVYVNKALTRLVLDLKTKCSNYVAGCQWTGEVRNLEVHLDKDCVVTEKKRTTDCLLQLEKRIERCEKQLEERDQRIQGYEIQLEAKEQRIQNIEKRVGEEGKKMQLYDKRLEKKEKRLQFCERGVQEKEKRLQICEKQLCERNQEYEALLIEVYQKEETIIALKEKQKELTGLTECDDPVTSKALQEWCQKKTDLEKQLYIDSLCERKEEKLALRLLQTSSMRYWDFGFKSSSLLHNASVSGCLEVVEYIHKTGMININSLSLSGRTALQYAVIHNKYDACKTLIRLGCKLDLITPNDETALDIAKDYNRHDIEKMLKESGAKYAKDV